jgi:hypothetical protein
MLNNMTIKIFLIKALKCFTPYGLIKLRRVLKMGRRPRTKEGLIVQYFRKRKNEIVDEETAQVIRFFQKNSFEMLPYEFVRKRHIIKGDSYFDTDTNMWYIIHENKKMYFPRSWEAGRCERYYDTLLIEQDSNSPHRYETPDFHVESGDIVADMGAAEGIFGLTNIEKVRKLYLFECNNEWIEALKKTFEPWNEKVCIINKYISNTTCENDITLDDFSAGIELPINFIKADIEGAEVQLLQGGTRILSSQKDLRMLLCTYHRQNDADNIKQILLDNGFLTEFTKGYMIFSSDSDLAEPYLRRALIRAKKKD